MLTRRLLYFFAMLLAVSGPFFYSSTAHAQATRTWVSGVGDDVNPCSRTAPCKTFAGAISKTAAGGFINVLDPGGFGAVTITNAAAIVHLRNLSIESPLPGNPSGQGNNGVEVVAAAQVHIEHCVIASFANNALNFHPSSGQLFVTDTSLYNNAGGGVVVQTGRATIENLHANGNGNGVVVTGNAI